MDKTAVFSDRPIGPGDKYPFELLIRVVEVDRGFHPDVGEVVTISTMPSWGLETVDLESMFDVRPDQLSDPPSGSPRGDAV